MARHRLGFAASMVKYLVLAINAASMFAGFLLIIVGAYISNADKTVTGITSNSLPVGLVCLGVFIAVISILGCGAAQRELGGLLKVYFLLLGVLIFFQIALGGIAFVKRSEADQILDQQWTTTMTSDPGLITDVQQYFSCCGFANVTDRAVPETCATDTKVSLSCKDVLRASFMDHLQTVGITGLVMGIIEMLALVFSLVLFSRIRIVQQRDNDVALLDKAKRLEREGRLEV